MEQQEKKRILIWEAVGFLVLVTVGSLLHFTYDWSEFSPIVGLFSPVNESVWEHMKLGFSALVFFSVVEFWFVGRGNPNYLVAKTLGILAMNVFIVIFFYTYTAFTGDDILWADILSFVLASALCQFVVYKVMTGRELPGIGSLISGGVLVALTALFVVFTFWTPQRGFFEDPNGLGFGTQWHVDHDARERGHNH